MFDNKLKNAFSGASADDRDAAAESTYAGYESDDLSSFTSSASFGGADLSSGLDAASEGLMDVVAGMFNRNAMVMPLAAMTALPLQPKQQTQPQAGTVNVATAHIATHQKIEVLDPSKMAQEASGKGAAGIEAQARGTLASAEAGIGKMQAAIKEQTQPQGGAGTPGQGTAPQQAGGGSPLSARSLATDAATGAAMTALVGAFCPAAVPVVAAISTVSTVGTVMSATWDAIGRASSQSAEANAAGTTLGRDAGRSTRREGGNTKGGLTAGYMASAEAPAAAAPAAQSPLLANMSRGPGFGRGVNEGAEYASETLRYTSMRLGSETLAGLATLRAASANANEALSAISIRKDKGVVTAANDMESDLASMSQTLETGPRARMLAPGAVA